MNFKLRSTTPTLDSIISEWHNCKRCPLHTRRNNVVIGEGNLKSRVLLVAEAPGEQEDRSGLPFQGKAGNKLNEFLARAGLRRDRDLYTTNTVSCRPYELNKDTGRDKNRRPSPEEIESCSPRLQSIFRIVDPLLLIVAGRTAADSLFPFGPPERVRNTYVHYVTHPAAFLYGDRDDKHELQMWEEIGDEIRGLDKTLPSNVDWAKFFRGQQMTSAKHLNRPEKK